MLHGTQKSLDGIELLPFEGKSLAGIQKHRLSYYHILSSSKFISSRLYRAYQPTHFPILYWWTRRTEERSAHWHIPRTMHARSHYKPSIINSCPPIAPLCYPNIRPNERAILVFHTYLMHCEKRHMATGFGGMGGSLSTGEKDATVDCAVRRYAVKKMIFSLIGQ